jgi:hypothetical protein
MEGCFLYSLPQGYVMRLEPSCARVGHWHMMDVPVPGVQKYWTQGTMTEIWITCHREAACVEKVFSGIAYLTRCKLAKVKLLQRYRREEAFMHSLLLIRNDTEWIEGRQESWFHGQDKPQWIQWPRITNSRKGCK